MRKTIIFLVVFLFLNGSVRAMVLDQSQEAYSDRLGFIFNNCAWAQTFTPGMSGQLEKIDIYLNHWIDNIIYDYPTVFSIVNVIDSTPSGSVLGKVTVSHFSVGFNSIDFLPESINLVAGVKYGIVISSDDPKQNLDASVHLQLCDIDAYSEGSLWSWQPEIGWSWVVRMNKNPPRREQWKPGVGRHPTR